MAPCTTIILSLYVPDQFHLAHPSHWLSGLRTQPTLLHSKGWVICFIAERENSPGPRMKEKGRLRSHWSFPSPHREACWGQAIHWLTCTVDLLCCSGTLFYLLLYMEDPENYQGHSSDPIYIWWMNEQMLNIIFQAFIFWYWSLFKNCISFLAVLKLFILLGITFLLLWNILPSMLAKMVLPIPKNFLVLPCKDWLASRWHILCRYLMLRFFHSDFPSALYLSKVCHYPWSALASSSVLLVILYYFYSFNLILVTFW